MKYIFDPEEGHETEAESVERPMNLGRSVDADAEITLGTRSLLGIFFGLVLICGIFFGLGYSLGRGSSSHAQTAQAAAETTGASSDNHAAKPSAQESLTPAPTPGTSQQQDISTGTNPASASPSQPTQAAANNPTAPPASADPGEESAPTTSRSAASEKPPVSAADNGPYGGLAPAMAKETSMPRAAPAAAPPTAKPTAATAAAGTGNDFVVQIAAVRVPQDADVLISALQRHGYNPIVRSEPQDKLYHIQLGPFPSRAAANAMRSKLASDGYNGLVK